MKKTALITGSCGLVGSECVRFFSKKGFRVIGIDNDLRQFFFGDSASVKENKFKLIEEVKDYLHFDLDIRNREDLKKLFKEYKFDLIIHTASQPSHDWAKDYPLIDFEVNTFATLNILENFRKYSPGGVFIFTSTNKVYGDRVNSFSFLELDKRYDLPANDPYYQGIDENFSIDSTLHSIFGADKLSADILVQEYGRYFSLKTGVFRLGCISGPYHKPAQLHGFLSYLVKCAVYNKEYTIYGYKGKQVRDNIHAYDLVTAFYYFYLNPKYGEVYNLGGGRYSNISILEAIELVEKITKKKFRFCYLDSPRKGDHIWWITDNSKFRKDYPSFNLSYKVEMILEEIYQNYKR